MSWWPCFATQRAGLIGSWLSSRASLQNSISVWKIGKLMLALTISSILVYFVLREALLTRKLEIHFPSSKSYLIRPWSLVHMSSCSALFLPTKRFWPQVSNLRRASAGLISGLTMSSCPCIWHWVWPTSSSSASPSRRFTAERSRRTSHYCIWLSYLGWRSLACSRDFHRSHVRTVSDMLRTMRLTRVVRL